MAYTQRITVEQVLEEARVTGKRPERGIAFGTACRKAYGVSECYRHWFGTGFDGFPLDTRLEGDREQATLAHADGVAGAAAFGLSPH